MLPIGIGGNTLPGYYLQSSLRLRDSVGAYLNWTPASAGNRRTWTYSAWVKLGEPVQGVGGGSLFYAGNTTSSPRGGIVFGNAGTSKISIYGVPYNSTTVALGLETTAEYRDPSAWYHIIVVLDTTQATSSDRCKLYINGEQVTSFGTTTYPSQNQELQYNDAILHATRHPSGDYRFDGYITEVNFVDGQALTPSDFGEYDTTTGVWKPKEYTGTYGTNGFYLNFSDSTSTTTLGYDQSPNSNNWTTNNISLTAGATYDLMNDVPTLTDEDTANFCTLNPLSVPQLTTTFSAGNLQFSGAGQMVGSMSMTFKSYYEYQMLNTTSQSFGVTPIETTSRGVGGAGGTNSALYFSNGNIFLNGSSAGTFTSYTTTDVVSLTYDPSTGNVSFYKNNVFQATVTISSTAEVVAYGVHNNGASGTYNFGQRPFAYTPPSGFKKLNTYNLPDSTIVDGSQYMNTVLYTGNGGTNAITGVGFSPDFVWYKRRNLAADNNLFDTIRGATKWLSSNKTNAETTISDSLTSFDSDGFTLGADGGSNASGSTFVAWNWRGSDSSAVSNTDGTITSTVSANTTSGFSVVTYVGTAAIATVGHGLGVAPSMIITKNRDTTTDWWVYHAALGNTKYVVLNTTAAEATSSTAWNNTSPTSTVFTLGGAGNPSNANQDVAYCFAEVEGFSKFNSYTGNGSADGPFVYTGFRPAFVLIKQSSVSGNSWQLLDTARETINPNDQVLFPNLSNAEGSLNATFDFLSNGLKVRTTDGTVNTNGATYIYMAFAENPFKQSLAR